MVFLSFTFLREPPRFSAELCVIAYALTGLYRKVTPSSAKNRKGSFTFGVWNFQLNHTAYLFLRNSKASCFSIFKASALVGMGLMWL